MASQVLCLPFCLIVVALVASPCHCFAWYGLPDETLEDSLSCKQVFVGVRNPCYRIFEDRESQVNNSFAVEDQEPSSSQPLQLNTISLDDNEHVSLVFISLRTLSEDVGKKLRYNHNSVVRMLLSAVDYISEPFSGSEREEITRFVCHFVYPTTICEDSATLGRYIQRRHYFLLIGQKSVNISESE